MGDRDVILSIVIDQLTEIYPVMRLLYSQASAVLVRQGIAVLLSRVLWSEAGVW